MSQSEISLILLMLSVIILGINGIDGLSTNVAKWMLLVFMFFNFISFFRALIKERKRKITHTKNKIHYLKTNNPIYKGDYMFFASRVIEALNEDHEKIKKETKILKEIDLPLKERIQAYDRLVPALVSHTEREEAVVYAYMKASHAPHLRFMAVEGKEEHLIADKLIGEIKTVETTSTEWTAKTKVLAELVDLHVKEEESEVFNTLKNEMNEKTDEDLCYKYENFSRGRKQQNKTDAGASLLT